MWGLANQRLVAQDTGIERTLKVVETDPVHAFPAHFTLEPATTTTE